MSNEHDKNADIREELTNAFANAILDECHTRRLSPAEAASVAIAAASMITAGLIALGLKPDITAEQALKDAGTLFGEQSLQTYRAMIEKRAAAPRRS